MLFSDLFDKPVTAQFDLHNGSSDGGALLLKAADRHLGLIDLCDCDPATSRCSSDYTDVDGYGVTSDCDDASAGSWATPGEVPGLRFGAGTKDDLSRDVPAEPEA